MKILLLVLAVIWISTSRRLEMAHDLQYESHDAGTFKVATAAQTPVKKRSLFLTNWVIQPQLTLTEVVEADHVAKTIRPG